MNQNTNKNEVARLLRQIDVEYEAAQRGLSGLAEVARHAFITRRMEQIGRYHGALQQLVGEQEAAHFLVEASNRLDKLDKGETCEQG